MYARLESLEPHPCCALAGKRVAVYCSVLQCVATMYARLVSLDTQHHTAARCNKLQQTATMYARLVSLEPHYSTQHHTAARCNKLQHTATMFVRLESLEPHPCPRGGPLHMDIAAITV